MVESIFPRVGYERVIGWCKTQKNEKLFGTSYETMCTLLEYLEDLNLLVQRGTGFVTTFQLLNVLFYML